MKEPQWVACTDPKKMLKYLHRQGSSRKRRLFAIACCRRVWHLFNGGVCHACIETAERFADGLVSKDELSEAESNAHDAYTVCRQAGNEAGMSAANAVYAATVDSIHVTWDIAESSASEVRTAKSQESDPGRRRSVAQAEGDVQIKLIREIFGNPFRPIAFNPAWRTSDVMLLTEGIYDDRAFDAMPILADALQDAGCDNDDILNHFRDPNATHVRGCWALDLVLGKE